MLGVIDLKKDKTYKAKSQPEIIDIPKYRFVMVDGEKSPESTGKDNYQAAMEIIFGIVYTIKFWDKKHPPPKGYAKFTMPPIETLWWMESGIDFDLAKPDDWRWTALHRVPEFVTQDYFTEIVTTVCDQKGKDIYKQARLEDFEEGTCVQILHTGPYDQETENINKIHDFANQRGYKLHGLHHELYLSDPRRVAPEKLKTIIRQPVEK